MGYYGEEEADQRKMSRSWNEGSRYQKLDEEGDDNESQTRQVRGRRRRAQTGSLLAISTESDSNEYEYTSDASDTYRKRGTPVRQKVYTSSSSLPRTGTVYATLPRKTRTTRLHDGNSQRASTKQSLIKESM